MPFKPWHTWYSILIWDQIISKFEKSIRCSTTGIKSVRASAANDSQSGLTIFCRVLRRLSIGRCFPDTPASSSLLLFSAMTSMIASSQNTCGVGSYVFQKVSANFARIDRYESYLFYHILIYGHNWLFANLRMIKSKG